MEAWCGKWQCKGGGANVKCLSPGNPKEAQKSYGHINDWNVKRVTSMNKLFAYMKDFNEDISNWDVCNVRDMESMFMMAKSFDQDLSRWQVCGDCKLNKDMFFDCATQGNELSWYRCRYR